MKAKKTARVFGAKKEVTKSDAKKLKPLAKYWHNRMNRDNWIVFTFSAAFWFALGYLFATV